MNTLLRFNLQSSQPMEHNRANEVVSLVERFYPQSINASSAKQAIEKLLQRTLKSTNLSVLKKEELDEFEEVKAILLTTSDFFDQLGEKL